MAREDSALFAEMILKDEATQKPIKMTAMHYEWHRVAATGKNMVLWSHPESGKSQQLVIARSLWILGRNPLARIAILAASEDQVKKLISAIREHIENNPVLHQIFPNLKRGKHWTDTAITVAGAKTDIKKDRSVAAATPTKKIQGARFDYLFIDDVLVHDNTRIPTQRKELATKIRSSAFSRLTKHAQIVFLANAFHPEDFAHELARQPGWWSKKYPVLTPTGESSWPEVWPLWRIKKVRDEYYGATEFARVMMCEPRADGDARFKQAWIDACKRRGRGMPVFYSLKEFVRFIGKKHWRKAGIRWNFKDPFVMPKGCHVFTTVDLAVSRRDSADSTVIFTGFVWPDGTRQVLNIQRGRWSAPEIKRRVIATNKAFKPQIVVVENNAAQDYMVQWVEEENASVPIRGFKTGKNKLSKEFGVESVATELELKRWVIPSTKDGHPADENIAEWVREMLYYSADSHTGDILMASWFFREAARVFADRMREAEDGTVDAHVRTIGEHAKRSYAHERSGFEELEHAA